MPSPSEPRRDASLPAVEPAVDLDRGVADRAAYWRVNLRVIFTLLAIWAGVSYGLSIGLVDQLNRVSLGHLPLGFWFSQQGSIYVFVGLIFVYAVLMDRIDQRYGVRE